MFFDPIMNTPDAIQRSAELRCPKCGNDARFYEVMEHVENLVDGGRNHLHQLIGEVAYYQCVDCGTEIRLSD